MSIKNLLFSTDGRINRSQWWLGQLLVIVIAVVFSMVFHFGIPHTLSVSVFSIHNFVIGMLIGVTYFWIHLALNIKRFHDINKQGGWVVLCYIPVFGFLITIIVCGIIAGDKYVNNYGVPQ